MLISASITDLKADEAARKILETIDQLPKTEVMHKFVHFNPLESYLDKNFIQAWLDFCCLMGIQPTLPKSDYTKFMEDGALNLQEYRLSKSKAPPSKKILNSLFKEPWRIRVQKSIKSWEELLNMDLFSLSEREWIKELGSHTDQGISFFSYIKLPESKSTKSEQTQQQRALECLEKLSPVCCTTKDAYFLLQEFIIQNRGWFSFLKTHKQSKNLWLEFEIDEIDALEKFISILVQNFNYLRNAEKFRLCNENDLTSVTFDIESFMLHAALESTIHHSILAKFSSPLSQVTENTKKKFSLLFCLDDRECSMRRHLENLSDDVQTFGVPGFFGLPLEIINQEKLHYKSCPPLVKPSFPIYIEHEKNWINKILYRVMNLIPGINILLNRKLLFQNKDPIIHWNDTDWKKSSNHRQEINFKSLKECAEYLAKFVKAFGVPIKSSAEKEVIVIISHGGSSINNPYFAAYDCAACSGNPGDLNARTLSLIGNDPRIRQILSTLHEIKYDQNILFLAVRHDTTTDEFKFFEEDIAPNQRDAFKNEFETLKDIIHIASGKNAIERCHKFEYKKNLLTEKKALKEVRKRGHSFFEPRPELGHSGCIAIIICPRAWIKHINFERRAFLISYDPELDTNFENLENILQAILPVCTGISYDYFCSRMSKHIYGTGSKLSTSIEGLIGITQGSQGTLLSGLSWQMIEAHQPIRPLLITSADETSIQKIMNRNELISNYVRGNWVRLALLEKSDIDLSTDFSSEPWIEFEDVT